MRLTRKKEQYSSVDNDAVGSVSGTTGPSVMKQYIFPCVSWRDSTWSISVINDILQVIISIVSFNPYAAGN